MENLVMASAPSVAQFVAHESHQCPEAKLVQAAKRGQSSAFGELCERYAQQLLRTAQRITRSHEDAQDAVQDAMLRAFVHFADFDGRSAFGTWLTRIAINSALMILRKKRTSLELAMESTHDSDGSALVYEIADRKPGPEKIYAKDEERTMLRKAVQKLRPRLREVIHIQQLQEGTMRETAETLGISVAAAKARLFHAKASLRKSSVLKLMRRPRTANPIRVLHAA